MVDSRRRRFDLAQIGRVVVAERLSCGSIEPAQGKFMSRIVLKFSF